ncbi:MAG: DUF2242 domain-containing protein [Giesbergeria sp.]|nr:DUF2242 domain-containing protein [Giesbergeria sp.]
MWKPLSLRAVWGAVLGAAPLALAVLLGGCVTPGGGKVLAPQEKFSSVSTFSRLFDATPAQTCEAARRALLSQGYIINTATADLIAGQKNFQPDADAHVQVMIRVVCVPESADARLSLGFVTALQDSYNLKKSNNSASLGVGGVGSVSLPFMTGGGESLVKVGSQTIEANDFYDSFFDLVKRFLLSNESPAPSEAADALDAPD